MQTFHTYQNLKAYKIQTWPSWKICNY